MCASVCIAVLLEWWAWPCASWLILRWLFIMIRNAACIVRPATRNTGVPRRPPAGLLPYPAARLPLLPETAGRTLQSLRSTLGTSPTRSRNCAGQLLRPARACLTIPNQSPCRSCASPPPITLPRLAEIWAKKIPIPVLLSSSSCFHAWPLSQVACIAVPAPSHVILMSPASPRRHFPISPDWPTWKHRRGRAR